MTLDQGYFPSDDRPDDLPYQQSFGNVSSFGPSGTASGVPEDYVITYVDGVAITVGDYASQFGTDQVYSGMPWEEFYRSKERAKYTFDRWAFNQGYTKTPAYSAEQFRRDAANLEDFDDSADLRRVGFVNPFVSGGGGGGGGRGGGGTPPAYTSPNRDALAQAIKTYVVAVTGTNRPDLVEASVNAYLSADRKAWDQQVAGKGGEEIDPMQAVYSLVRGSAPYKSIHKLRPESVDELDWVTSRQGKLRSVGLSDARSEALGISQATVGSNDEALVGAAEMQFNADTGRMLQTQRDALKRAGSAAMGLL